MAGNQKKEKEQGQGNWLSDSDEFSSHEPLKEHPNQKAQKRIEKKNKPQLGRKKDAPGTKVEINIKEIDRVEGIPTVLITGSGRRNDVVNINLPIPIEDYERIKSESNLSGSFIALIRYALNKLDDENKALVVNHIKNS